MLKRTTKPGLFVSGCVAIAVCTSCETAVAQIQSGSGTDWLRGKRLQDSSGLPVSVSWKQSPIRQQLNQFARQQKRAIFLDRRVDPGLRQSFEFLDLTTDQIVWRTAKANGLGVARVGDLLYVGPREVAAQLPLVIDQVTRRIDKRVRKKWTSRSEIQWSEATGTAEISQWLEQQHDIRFVTPIPFDVWAEGDWPPLELVEQMSLFLVGFGLSFDVSADGKDVRLRAFPEIESGNLKLRLPRKARFDVPGARQMFPDLKIARAGKTLSATGPVERIAELEAWLVEQNPAGNPPGAGKKVQRTFDLETTARRGDVLATVASQTGRELELRGAVGELLQQRVTLNLKKASLETLLSSCLEGTGLEFQLTEKKLLILQN